VLKNLELQDNPKTANKLKTKQAADDDSLPETYTLKQLYL